MSTPSTPVSICRDCIKDPCLVQLLKPQFVRIQCSFCEVPGLGMALEDLASTIEPNLREYLQTGEPQYMGESAPLRFEEEGESLSATLELELDIPYEAAEVVAERLIENDAWAWRDGDDPFFSEEHNYHRRYWSASKFAEAWEGFSRRVKHERRFFDTGRELQDILGARQLISGRRTARF